MSILSSNQDFLFIYVSNRVFFVITVIKYILKSSFGNSKLLIRKIRLDWKIKIQKYARTRSKLIIILRYIEMCWRHDGRGLLHHLCGDCFGYWENPKREVVMKELLCRQFFFLFGNASLIFTVLTYTLINTIIHVWDNYGL